jgi:hypothetical protein
MVRIENTLWCDGCGVEILWAPVFLIISIIAARNAVEVKNVIVRSSKKNRATSDASRRLLHHPGLEPGTVLMRGK